MRTRSRAINFAPTKRPHVAAKMDAILIELACRELENIFARRPASRNLFATSKQGKSTFKCGEASENLL